MRICWTLLNSIKFNDFMQSQPKLCYTWPRSFRLVLYPLSMFHLCCCCFTNCRDEILVGKTCDKTSKATGNRRKSHEINWIGFVCAHFKHFKSFNPNETDIDLTYIRAQRIGHRKIWMVCVLNRRMKRRNVSISKSKYKVSSFQVHSYLKWIFFSPCVPFSLCSMH